MAKTTIELNGRVYDVTTGLPVGKEAKQEKTLIATTSETPKKRFIDGIRRPSGQANSIVHKPATKKPAVAQAKKRATSKPAQKVHKRQQRAKVLLRTAVKPPFKKTVQEACSAITEVPKVAVVNALDRAKQVPKSARISRFASTVKEQPAPKMLVKQPAVRVSAERVKPVTKQTPKETLIKQGVAEAQSHHEKAPKKKKNKKLGWLATSLAAMLVVGYVVYLNLPNLAMKVAAVRAGFSANLPSYSPGGFRLSGPIAYSTGQITIGYHSTTDQRAYNITQKKSDWDSESLLTNYVASKPDYQTYRDHGLTIYMFGDNNATWVNSGVWYTIDGKSQLSAQQIVKIAASL